MNPAPVENNSDLRRDLNNIVKKAACSAGRIPSFVWNDLYAEIEKRKGINVSSIAEKYKLGKIDVLENNGLLKDAIAIVKTKYGVKYD